MDICKDSLSLSGFSGYGESLSSVTSDTIRIPCNNKVKTTPDTSIIIKQLIKKPLNPRKMAKEITLTDV